MSNSSNVEEESLLQYGPKKEIFTENDKTKKKITMPSETNPGVKETLNAMFNPKEWEEAGRQFIQYVSSEPATRERAKELFANLENKIKERQARVKGICPVREELYSQCFDEIIRQVTIECPERGLLLLRVRDQIKMTIASYQTLYESSILYGIRKRVQSENGKDELKKKLEASKKKKIELVNKKMELVGKLKALKKQIAERNAVEEERRQEEANFLDKQIENLETFLRSIDNTAKK